MFRSLRVKRQPDKIVPDPGGISTEQLARDSSIPITLHQINQLPENARQRIYRCLLPPSLLYNYQLDPVTWKGPDGVRLVRLKAESNLGSVSLAAEKVTDSDDPFIFLELADNAVNGIDLNLILLNDPDSQRFCTDVDETGQPTYFGTVRRHLEEEIRAKAAGLAPGQVRMGSGALHLVLHQVESFLSALGHRAYFLEPLSYASAWIFERRGFAYVRGHKLMDDIHKEFQPGGRLYQALDGSTPFRQPDQWQTVRGRAWAIHDGILEGIDARWNALRMVKQVGRAAGVETFPGAVY